MPQVYAVDEANESGPGYYRTVAEAFAEARKVSRISDLPIEVRRCTIQRADLATLLTILNGRGWSTDDVLVATAHRGRISKSRKG